MNFGPKTERGSTDAEAVVGMRVSLRIFMVTRTVWSSRSWIPSTLPTVMPRTFTVDWSSRPNPARSTLT